MASSGQIGFPLGGSRFTPRDLRAGPGVGGPRDAAATVASDWLIGGAPAEHPIEAAFIESAAAVHGPVVGASIDAAAVAGASTVAAPAVGAAVVAGFAASSAVVYAPTVESGAEPEPEPEPYYRPIGGWVQIPYNLRNRRRWRRKRVEEEELVALAAAED